MKPRHTMNRRHVLAAFGAMVLIAVVVVLTLLISALNSVQP